LTATGPDGVRDNFISRYFYSFYIFRFSNIACDVATVTIYLTTTMDVRFFLIQLPSTWLVKTRDCMINNRTIINRTINRSV